MSLVIGQNAKPVIPPKKNRRNERKYDTHIYKERHLVERFFCKLKEFRRIATRSRSWRLLSWQWSLSLHVELYSKVVFEEVGGVTYPVG
ncbi:hypothetical protein [Desulfovibrio inopinatus]|uniref:hypothetical protein n=1 Tax=Desulfovibrio inopinatus TaxID=102109 RepID=UPI003CCBE12B